jgi:hypothetical protein
MPVIAVERRSHCAASCFRAHRPLQSVTEEDATAVGTGCGTSLANAAAGGA